MSDVIARLAAIVGEHNVILGEEQAPFLTDWLGKYRGSALAVVRPGSVDEVSAVMALCAERTFRSFPKEAIPACRAARPRTGRGEAVVLSLARMNRVRAVDPVGNTITGRCRDRPGERPWRRERGRPLLSLEPRRRGKLHDRRKPGGQCRRRRRPALRTMRELTLGLEVVLSDGRVWDGIDRPAQGQHRLRAARPVHRLGRHLGVITGAVLKLFPAPRARANAFVAVQDVDAALALLSIVRARGGDRLTAFEFMTATRSR